MSRYLLDSTVLIDFSSGVAPVTTRVLTLIRNGNEMGVSPVSIAEYYAGVRLGDDPAMDRFLSGLACWGTTRPIAMIARDYRNRFRRRHGKQLPTADTLIAATARHYGATLLTNNVKDFPMTDITVERLGI
jgi:hypothetical protein